MGSLMGESNPNISVLIADSNQTQSYVLATALRRQARFKVSTCPSEITSCMQILDTESPQLLLLNITYQEGPDYLSEVLRKVTSAHPELPIVILLPTYSRDLFFRALRTGARGVFCLSSQPFKALCSCIQAVYEGQAWITNEQLRDLMALLEQPPVRNITNYAGRPLLSARENEVTTLVAEGLSNREIAEQLKVAENTIKKALARIFEKLGISNRVELVLYVFAQRSHLTTEAGRRLDGMKVIHGGKPESTWCADKKIRCEVEIAV
jgi:DNA-binding NarL/FixJ family response regulator